MDLLKIDENQDAYFRKGDDWALVRSIEKEDMLELVKHIATDPNSELMECSNSKDIKNQIEKTIYLQLYKDLKDLKDNKVTYLQEINEEFEAYERANGLAEIED